MVRLRSGGRQAIFGIDREELRRNRHDREMPLVGPMPHLVPRGMPEHPAGGAIEIDGLPQGVTEARPQIVQVSPTLTIVTLCFVLSPEAGREAVTEMADAKGGVLCASREAFEAAVEYRRQQPAVWLREHVPGEFSSADEYRPLPSASLVTARHFDPSVYLPAEEVPADAQYRLAAMQTRGATWRSKHDPALGLSFDEVDATSPLLFGGQSDALARMLQAVAQIPERVNPVANNAPLLLSALFATWATACLLEEYRSRLRTIRDRPTKQRSTRRPVRQLQTALKDLPFLADASMVADDLAGFEEPPSLFMRLNEFSRPIVASNTTGQLKADLVLAVRVRAADVYCTAEHARSMLATAANVHAASAGVRATWWAAAAAVVGLLALVATLIT